MNLRKALDRAKNEREIQINSAGTHAAKGPPPDRSGWLPPVYSQSKTVTIDLPTAVKNHCVALSTEFAEVNYYKVLRTQLRQIGQQKKWNTMMVTSASPNEGKTVTSINLAATFAREYNHTVLLVDADLRMQMVHRYLGYSSQVGMLDYLEGKADMNEIITWPGIEKFTVISGSRVVVDSSELIGSPRMQSLMQELKNRYDDRYVIFDAPPILGVADALAFAPLVDCIIIVVGAGITSRHDLKEALALLPQEKIAGFVLNRFKGPNRMYGKYGYRYGT
ncbi:CpsD/CapB family tyrosine-protein kinase [Desulfosarcina sp.]|uniref:CpsD/CapB family tyrosine-protein kinase n=1 Tax=Desulfosarcina sp. TaxID=2027861 RepID=UPI003970D359